MPRVPILQQSLHEGGVEVMAQVHVRQLRGQGPQHYVTTCVAAFRHRLSNGLRFVLGYHPCHLLRCAAKALCAVAGLSCQPTQQHFCVALVVMYISKPILHIMLLYASRSCRKSALSYLPVVVYHQRRDRIQKAKSIRCYD